MSPSSLALGAVLTPREPLAGLFSTLHRTGQRLGGGLGHPVGKGRPSLSCTLYTSAPHELLRHWNLRVVSPEFRDLGLVFFFIVFWFVGLFVFEVSFYKTIMPALP